MGKAIQIPVGTRFGILRTVSDTFLVDCPGNGGKRRTSVTVRCDCGVVKDVLTGNLRRGLTSSCGCQPGGPRKHGAASGRNRGEARGKRTGLYARWAGMKDRCYRAKNQDYPNYGGRGIKVCEAWRTSFDTFQEWAFAAGYTEGQGLQLDRWDADLDYCPENCHWLLPRNHARKDKYWLGEALHRKVEADAQQLGIGQRAFIRRIVEMHYGISGSEEVVI